MANIVADKAVGEVDVRFKTIVEAEKSIADVQRIVETNYVPHTKTTVTGNVIKFMPLKLHLECSGCTNTMQVRLKSSGWQNRVSNMLAALLTRPGRP